MSMIPTIILAIPGIGDLYERGKLDELGKPIDPVRGVEDKRNPVEVIADGGAAVARGVVGKVGDFIEDAKSDAFKRILVLLALALFVYWVYKKIQGSTK